MATASDNQEIKAQLSDSELNWLKVQKFVTGSPHWAFWTKLLINRRENDGELPPGVLEDRRKVDWMRTLEKIARDAEESKGFLSALFSGLGQAVAERKAKKK